MHGCGLRIGEALAVNLRYRINRGRTLRVKEQVNPAAQLKPLKFYGHLVPSSFDRASAALDAAYNESRRRPSRKPRN